MAEGAVGNISLVILQFVKETGPIHKVGIGSPICEKAFTSFIQRSMTSVFVSSTKNISKVVLITVLRSAPSDTYTLCMSTPFVLTHS